MKDQGNATIGQDTFIKGEISKANQIDVFGHVEGRINAERLVVHEGGRVDGVIKTDTAEIRGRLDGVATVRNLIRIGNAGRVTGNIRYGQLAVEPGGDLEADVRNVPPELGGDLNLTVRRGRTAKVLTSDLTAYDPDDSPDRLTFSVSNAQGGFVALARAPAAAVERFTQADLQAGAVLFVHDGSAAGTATFDVVVADSKGGSSGSAKTVTIAVTA
jgi:cytoskeletal protein CcmA (bactofilin family)